MHDRGDRALWKPLLASAAGWSGVAVLGGIATTIGPWYWALKKPWFQPPDWAFGPAWTLIFALTAIASAMAWRAGPDNAGRRRWVSALVLNGLLNVAWSVLFFYLRRPDLALIEVGLLWLSIAVLVWMARSRSSPAALLLVPYLVWVSFAAVLNAAVVRLNAPF
ncbi:MAG TPA: tryptophan-rich sensory protein [Hyphomicrobiaceae bacterium]|nr:tryptophan-rich sensory protein [Hyphomicrobiaceae bacterium]